MKMQPRVQLDPGFKARQSRPTVTVSAPARRPVALYIFLALAVAGLVGYGAAYFF